MKKILVGLLALLASGGAPQAQSTGASSRPLVTHRGVRVSERAPEATDGAPRYQVGDLWCRTDKSCWRAASIARNAAVWRATTTGRSPTLPLDALGTPALAACGTMLMTRNARIVALNKAIDVWRGSDGAITTIGWSADGTVDASALTRFLAGSWGEVARCHDQSTDAAGNPHGNDGTITPGFTWDIDAKPRPEATTSGAGCPNGAQNFAVQGGQATPSIGPTTIRFNVAGGAITGAGSVINRGSYFGGNDHVPSGVVALGGVACSTPPTIRYSSVHIAPSVGVNTVRGHRSISFSQYYGQIRANETLGFENIRWAFNNGATYTRRNFTYLFAGQLHSAMIAAPALAVLGPIVGHIEWNTSGGDGTVGRRVDVPIMGMKNLGTVPLVARTSPAVLWMSGAPAGYTLGIDDRAALLSTPPANVAQAEFNLSTRGGGDSGDYEMLGMILVPSTLGTQRLLDARQALTVQMGAVPQADTLLVAVGDSITYGTTAPSNNNYTKLLQMRGLLDRDYTAIDFGSPGARFTGSRNRHDFLDSVSGDFANVPIAGYARVVVTVALGTNDMGVGRANGAATFANAQAYVAALHALGPNVQVALATVLPRCDRPFPEIASYNALVRSAMRTGMPAQRPDAIIDWAADRFWTRADWAESLATGACLHPNDAGQEDMAVTEAPVLNALAGAGSGL